MNQQPKSFTEFTLERRGFRAFTEANRARQQPEPLPEAPRRVSGVRGAGLDNFRQRRDYLASLGDRRQEAATISDNFAGGAIGRAKDLAYNLGDKLSPGQPFAEERAAVKEKYGEEMATGAGRAGGMLIDELALLPVGGVVGGAVKGAARTLSEAKPVASLLARASAAKDKASRSKQFIHAVDEDLAKALPEQKRIQDRLLGTFPNDPKAWTEEQNRLWHAMQAKGVPDLRDTRKFEQNFAKHFMEANERVAGLQNTRKLAEKSLQKAKASSPPALLTAPLRGAQGFLGSNIVEGAARGAAGGAVLADEGQSDDAALVGGMLGGAIPFAGTLGRGLGAGADFAARVPARGLALGADALNKRWGKHISRDFGVDGIQRLDPKITNFFTKDAIHKIASGAWAPSKTVSWIGKTFPEKLRPAARDFIAAELGVALTDEE